ncbi:hypothetical protein ERO13_D12G117900v2 [Gossypium hirsutum]|nr:hypothetical protein ERO13_D12G117900v2 [Gossypium hirsutum]
MANKQQPSFTLAFVAAALILLAGQVTARREIIEVKGRAVTDPILEAKLIDMLEETERTKDKVPVLGNSEMVKYCDNAYGMSIENLKKALGMLQRGIKSPQGFKELEAIVLVVMKAYEECDHVFAENAKPSPFGISNTKLKSLGTKCKQYAEEDAKQN